MVYLAMWEPEAKSIGAGGSSSHAGATPASAALHSLVSPGASPVAARKRGPVSCSGQLAGAGEGHPIARERRWRASQLGMAGG